MDWLSIERVCLALNILTGVALDENIEGCSSYFEHWFKMFFRRAHREMESLFIAM